jgi:serine/threonine-protein kinase
MIGGQLGVETVLEGSVRTAGTRLRVTAQLTSVADGYQIWSERYDRQMKDVFDIQDEIAKAIVGALKVKLLGDADAAIVKRATDNVEAYQLCLKARYHWFKWTDDAFRKATQLFEQALAIDPNYPLALFGLADAYIASAVVGLERDASTCEAMFERAIRLDPELAEAHAILGLVQGMWTWRWSLAQQHFDTAMRLGPRSSHVLGAHGLHLSLLGQFEEAVALGRRGVELDPLMPFWNVMLTQVYVCSRRYDEAIRQADATLDLVPTYWMAHVYRGLALAGLGHVTEAAAALERAVTHSNGVPYARGWLGFVLAKAGRVEEADVQLQTLLGRARQGYMPALSLACIYAGLNDREGALASIDRARAQQDLWLSWHVGPLFIFDDLRSDPRFADLHRRVFGA